MLTTRASAKGGVGKATSAVHIVAVLASYDKTLLIDGDPNHSALKWAKRGNLPYMVVDLMAAPKYTRHFKHIVFDTPARPNIDDLEALSDGCDLLIIPTTETVNMFDRLKCNRYRILLTIVPPTPRKTGRKQELP